MLVTGEAANAHGDYPSWHRAVAYGCYTTSTTGSWTVMSSVQMNRADNYPLAIYGMGGGYYDPQTGAITGQAWQLIDNNTQQWLWYRVVVLTPLASGGYSYDYGNWIRRKEQLGDQTDGFSTEVQLDNGSWVTSDYSMTGHFDGSKWVGNPSDLSFVSRNTIMAGVALGRGWKYVYGQMWWGPIYNSARKPVFAGYDHWEPLGWVNCS
jgi:hypothetical protein